MKKRGFVLAVVLILGFSMFASFVNEDSTQYITGKVVSGGPKPNMGDCVKSEIPKGATASGKGKSRSMSFARTICGNDARKSLLKAYCPPPGDTKHTICVGGQLVMTYISNIQCKKNTDSGVYACTCDATQKSDECYAKCCAPLEKKETTSIMSEMEGGLFNPDVDQEYVYEAEVGNTIHTQCFN